MSAETDVRVALYAVNTPAKVHRFLLCSCCWESAAAYYEALRWPCVRVRDATPEEELFHVCLD